MLHQRCQWQKPSIWLHPSLHGYFWGFNWWVATVSANKERPELDFKSTSLCQHCQWQMPGIWLHPSLDTFFWGFNRWAAALSVNWERPKLDFESEDAWQWGCVLVRMCGGGGKIDHWVFRVSRECVIYFLFFIFYFWEGDKQIINEKVER